MAMKTEYGTMVEYRKSGEAQERRKRFTGDDHGVEASKFVADHVCGIKLEDFEKVVPKADRKLYEQRVISGRADQESIQMMMKKVAPWNWHVMIPISREVEVPAVAVA